MGYYNLRVYNSGIKLVDATMLPLTEPSTDVATNMELRAVGFHVL